MHNHKSLNLTLELLVRQPKYLQLSQYTKYI